MMNLYNDLRERCLVITKRNKSRGIGPQYKIDPDNYLKFFINDNSSEFTFEHVIDRFFEDYLNGVKFSSSSKIDKNQYFNILREYVRDPDLFFISRRSIYGILDCICRISVNIAVYTNLIYFAEYYIEYVRTSKQNVDKNSLIRKIFVSAVFDKYADIVFSYFIEKLREYNIQRTLYDILSVFLTWSKTDFGYSRSNHGIMDIILLLMHARYDIGKKDAFVLINKCVDIQHNISDLHNNYFNGGTYTNQLMSNGSLDSRHLHSNYLVTFFKIVKFIIRRLKLNGSITFTKFIRELFKLTKNKNIYSSYIVFKNPQIQRSHTYDIGDIKIISDPAQLYMGDVIQYCVFILSADYYIDQMLSTKSLFDCDSYVIQFVMFIYQTVCLKQDVRIFGKDELENVKKYLKNQNYDTTSKLLLVLPDTVDTINEYEYANIDTITYVYVHNPLIEIKSHAFEYCTKLKFVPLYSNMSIGDYAFYGCINIKKSDYVGLNLKLGYKAMYD